MGPLAWQPARLQEVETPWVNEVKRLDLTSLGFSEKGTRSLHKSPSPYVTASYRNVEKKKAASCKELSLRPSETVAPGTASRPIGCPCCPLQRPTPT